ncbi:hypothetical protein D3C79_830450 [compost metagenome]
MLGDAAAGITENDRLDDILHPWFHQVLDLFQRTPGNRLQAEGHVVLHLQVAPAIGFHQFMVAAQEILAVDPAQPGHLLAPQRRAVAVDQGFVQIENCQCHALNLLRPLPVAPWGRSTRIPAGRPRAGRPMSD